MSRPAALLLSCPRESVTVSEAWYVPGFVYVCEIVGLDCVTGVEPSPKRNVYDATWSPASASDEPEASNATVSGTEPLVGVACNAAAGGVFAAQKSLPESVYVPLLVESASTRKIPTRVLVSPWMPEITEPADGGTPFAGCVGSEFWVSLSFGSVIVIVPSVPNVPSASPSTFSLLKPEVGSTSKRP